MNLLRNISIKSFLIGVVGLLVVILTIESFKDFSNTYGESSDIERIGMANELSDLLLDASGFEAKERGMTAIAISSGDIVDRSLVEKIIEARTKGDAAFSKALAMAEKLSGNSKDSGVLGNSIKRSKTAYSEMLTGRKTADANFNEKVKNYPPQEWFKLVTAFIDANANLRLAAFAIGSSGDTHQDAMRMNVELKQAVWLVSEYAGRERAAVGSFVSAKKPIDPATMEKLNTYRVIVDLNLKSILQLKESNFAGPEVMKSVAVMEDVFLVSFNETRKGVYAHAAAGDYQISGKEWIDRSSAAINTILDVSAAVGRMVNEKVEADLSKSKWKMLFSLAALVVIIVIGILAIIIIRKKVISPMLYLNGTMARIEKSGDLTVKLEVNSTDENGQMAETFNRMIDRFNAVIQEIHAAVAQLASSSEELSATATQIAHGSSAQNDRATQVSTSSQEMNATLIEVSKNVSGAAEAARLASGVASKGGEIVAVTISSMNGIAGTAGESQKIISTLGGRSKEIGNIVNVIDDIADQTNLLALNAAIEAARAGEQGRGFAVVADEVRKLAEKTMKATKEIGAMIKAMQDETAKAIESTSNEVKAVENGMKLASTAGEALRDIVVKVDVVTSMMQHISTATEEQSAATEQITGDIENVASVIAETAAGAQQIARTSEEISGLATNLKSMVEVFKTAQLAGKKVIPIREKAGNVLPMPTRVEADFV